MSSLVALGNEVDIGAGGFLANIPFVSDFSMAWSFIGDLLAFFIGENSLVNADIIALEGVSNLILLHPVASWVIKLVLLLWNILVLLSGFFVEFLAFFVVVNVGVVLGWLTLGSNSGNEGSNDGKLHL